MVWKAEGADRGSEVLSLVFSPGGSVLASGAGLTDSSIRLWDAASGKMIRRLEDHRRFIFALQFAADGRTLTSASGDLTIRIWDVANGNVLNTLRGHKLEVWRLAFPTDTTLISDGKDGFVYLWDTASRRNDPTAIQVPDVIAEWRIATDNQSMLTVDYEGHVARYRGRGFSEKESVMELGAIGPISALPENRVHPEQISPNLRFIAVQRNDAEDQVEVWDTVTARFRHGFRAARNTFPVAVFLDDRTLRVIAERDAAAETVLCREWDVASGRELRSWRMSTPASGIIRITFFPDGRRCLVTGSSGSVLHDLHTGTEQSRLWRLTHDAARLNSPLTGSTSPRRSWAGTSPSSGRRRPFEKSPRFHPR